MGTTRAIFTTPTHPYTKALLSATPVPDPDAKPRRIVFDPAKLAPDAPLRLVGDEHWAAV
jgi:ABC-type oligopeptide transport system ATPase subunit